MGAYDLVHKLEHELGIGIGETTSDGEFTLSEAECLDFCGSATVVQVGDKYFVNLTAENIMGLIDDLRSSKDYTPAKLADSIVQIHRTGASLKPGGSYTPESLKLPAGPML
jgi:NADH-quinone oxidoreductase subunit E